MDLYRIFQGILSAAILIYIAYRWVRMYKIESIINRLIQEYYQEKKIELMSIRELKGLEKVKLKVSLLSSFGKVINIFTSIDNNHYRFVEFRNKSGELTNDFIGFSIKGKELTNFRTL